MKQTSLTMTQKTLGRKFKQCNWNTEGLLYIIIKPLLLVLISTGRHGLLQFPVSLLPEVLLYLHQSALITCATRRLFFLFLRIWAQSGIYILCSRFLCLCRGLRLLFGLIADTHANRHWADDRSRTVTEKLTYVTSITKSESGNHRLYLRGQNWLQERRLLNINLVKSVPAPLPLLWWIQLHTCSFNWARSGFCFQFCYSGILSIKNNIW